MKKQILVGLACIAICGCFAIKFVGNGKSDKNNLLLENVEALSDSENSESTYVICYYKSKVRVGYTYYDCATCRKVYDEKAIGDYSKCFYK